MKKIISLIALFCLFLCLSAVFASCSSNNKGNGNITNPSISTKETVIVNFAFNGGTVLEGSAMVKIEKNSLLEAKVLPRVQKNGYKLIGWSYDAYGEKLWSVSDTFEENTTLYAVWQSLTEEEIETIYVYFKVMGGYVIDGKTEVELAKGEHLKMSKVPEVERDGYELVCWAYTKNDPYDPWDPDDKFRDDTTLYAVWKEIDNSTTDVPSDDNTPKVTIWYNTGIGYFESNYDYERIIEVGTRITSHPTPLYHSPSMLFEGWYKDPQYKVEVSLSDKYYEETTLYAKWTEQTMCNDGSYNHVWGPYEDGEDATCTEPATLYRYCIYCSARITSPGGPALEHDWGAWTESFMRKERTCRRILCGDKEIVVFENITASLLGNDPSMQIRNSGNFYSVPFTNLINNAWDESNGSYVGPKGNGEAWVAFDFVSPAYFDRIYFKGQGVTTIDILVKYQGETDYVFLGSRGAADNKENTPYVEVDSSKKIVSVMFRESYPIQGMSKWQEVAFVKVDDEN